MFTRTSGASIIMELDSITCSSGREFDGLSYKSALPAIPLNAGLPSSISVAVVDKSLSAARISIASSSISPTTFGPPPICLASRRLLST